MNKMISSFMFVGLLLLAACNFSVEYGSGGSNEKEDLQLQMTKADEEAGVTMEESEVYQFLDEFVKEDPKYGVVNDFSMRSATMITDAEGNEQMVFIAVNRLGEPIKNVEFIFSLGDSENNMIWDRVHITMNEEVAGVLENNAAMPILLPITSDEQMELINTINQDDLQMDFAEFSYESVE
ncbi:hypothetical protein [Virgibacillus kimchii]